MLLGLRQEKCLATFFELRKDWPIPPTNNTMIATNSKPPIKIEPKNQINQPSVQQHQNQCNVDGDQIVPFARIQKKTGKASTKSNSSKPTKTFKHKIHSRKILSKPKTWGKFKLRTLSASKTTRYHKTPSPPRHNPSKYWTHMQSKSIWEESGMRKWKDSTKSMDLIISQTQS